MNYTKEQAEEFKEEFLDWFGRTSSLLNNGFKDFLDHKFPKKVSGWYKVLNNVNELVYLNFENRILYGWDKNGNYQYFEGVNIKEVEDQPATPQEVEQRLIEEAKRRGFVEGAVVANAVNQSTHEIKIEPTFRYTSYYSKEELMCDYNDNSQFTAFTNGKWAEIIEQPETEQLEQDYIKFNKEAIDDIIKKYNIQPSMITNYGSLVLSQDELSRTLKKAEKIVDKLNHLLSLHHS